MRVGIIGFGNMGSAIAKRLVQQGYTVAGWNRTKDKVTKIEGVAPLSSQWEVLKSSDITLVVLSDDEAVESVILENGEMLSSLPMGTVIANVSTITPYMSMRLYRELKRRGLKYIEAPVLGGPQAALSGSLISLIGGEREMLNVAREVFRAVAREIFYAGEVPKAAALKLVFNSGTFTAVELIGEMLSLASAWEIDTELVKEIASKTVLSQLFSTYLERGLDQKFPPGFYLDLVAKDLSYALLSSRKGSSFIPSIAGAYEAYISAARSGFGKKDYASIIRYLMRGASEQ
ncbi:MAG: NAD(P)-dependent oxidoreductase [Fervidicoccaceae archaeon]